MLKEKLPSQKATHFIDILNTYPLANKKITNRSLQDIISYKEIKKETAGKFFFSDNRISDNISDFNEILRVAMQLPIERYGDQLIVVSPVDFHGHESVIKGTISVLQKGAKGSPVNIVIPGYGNVPQILSIPYLSMNNQIQDCTVVGIEIFHDLNAVDRVKVGSSIQNLQAAFAVAITATQEAIHIAHEAGSKAVVIGGSFGAKTINAQLNLAEEHSLELADRYIAIEGGRFQETFRGEYYRNKMKNTNIVDHPSLSEGYAFPNQVEVLPEISRQLVTAFINPHDEIALAQERCWNGSDRLISIDGSHFTAPLKNIFRIRKIISEDLLGLNN